jgi:hypothetical protein
MLDLLDLEVELTVLLGIHVPSPGPRRAGSAIVVPGLSGIAS